MLTIDGSQGEGGGQVLRTALALSIVTATPFRIERIRAGRSRPGLMRQHLAAVRAAAAICGAEVTGDALGAQQLAFAPGPVRPGDYRFAIGSAGSTMLLLQTVLLPLALAAAPSRLALEGGTHNGMAPPFEFVDRVWLPLLRRMGIDARATLQRPGFYPAGGGAARVEIAPAGPAAPLVLEAVGAITGRRAEILAANLPPVVVERERAVLERLTGWPASDIEIRAQTDAPGPGNAVLLTLEQEALCELFTAIGERGLSAEAVATRAVEEMRRYLAAQAPVGPDLADQLLLPMALRAGGRFVTGEPTLHTLTNRTVIEAFLGPGRVTIAPSAEGRFEVSVLPAGSR